MGIIFSFSIFYLLWQKEVSISLLAQCILPSNEKCNNNSHDLLSCISVCRFIILIRICSIIILVDNIILYTYYKLDNYVIFYSYYKLRWTLFMEKYIHRNQIKNTILCVLYHIILCYIWNLLFSNWLTHLSFSSLF